MSASYVEKVHQLMNSENPDCWIGFECCGCCVFNADELVLPPYQQCYRFIVPPHRRKENCEERYVTGPNGETEVRFYTKPRVDWTVQNWAVARIEHGP